MANLAAVAEAASTVRNILLLVLYYYYLKYGKFSENTVAGITFLYCHECNILPIVYVIYILDIVYLI